MTKAIFFDIDGTLVSFETHGIPASTVEAIAAARAHGVKVFIATGRPEILINNLDALQSRGLIDGYVTMNGGYCFVGNEVIYKSAIPADEARVLLDYCTARLIPCVVVGERDICVCHADDRVRSIFYEYLHAAPIPEVSPDEALRNRAAFQMTPFITENQEAELHPHIPHCEVGRWHPAFADVTALGNCIRTSHTARWDAGIPPLPTLPPWEIPNNWVSTRYAATSASTWQTRWPSETGATTSPCCATQASASPWATPTTR